MAEDGQAKKEEAIPLESPEIEELGQAESDGRNADVDFQEDEESEESVYFFNLAPGPGRPVDREFAEIIRLLEAELDMPVWVLIQCGNVPSIQNSINERVKDAFYLFRREISESDRIALVIDSAGGFAEAAYQIATLFQQADEGFIAIVPRYAKSAATLLALGASEIILGRYAELGPLDAQIYDEDREDTMSALDDVQSLERLTAYALKTVDEVMYLLIRRTGKRMLDLLPLALNFVSGIMRPMLEDVDIVTYNQRARLIKSAEEYAIRLLSNKYPKGLAELIANHFVESYPEHGFVIDAKESISLGEDERTMVDLDLITVPTGNLAEIIDVMYSHLAQCRRVYIGQLVKEEGHEEDE